MSLGQVNARTIWNQQWWPGCNYGHRDQEYVNLRYLANSKTTGDGWDLTTGNDIKTYMLSLCEADDLKRKIITNNMTMRVFHFKLDVNQPETLAGGPMKGKGQRSYTVRWSTSNNSKFMFGSVFHWIPVWICSNWTKYCNMLLFKTLHNWYH